MLRAEATFFTLLIGAALVWSLPALLGWAYPVCVVPVAGLELAEALR